MANHVADDRLTSLESFTAVARRLSFAGAANDLGISASALSRRIAQLEASLGTRLFQRTTRHVSLTEAGAVFLQHVTEALSRLSDAQAAVSHYATVPTGQLRVAMPIMLGQLHIAPLLPEFLRRNPKVNLELAFSDWLTDLVLEGFDVGVRVGALESSDLVARKLAPNRRVICASPEYVKHHGAPETPEQLARHACLQFSTYRSPYHWRLQRGRRTLDTVIAPVMRADNGEALRQAALAGCGIMLSATFVVGEDLKAGRLVRVLPEWEGAESWIWAVYPRTRFLPLKVRAFIDFLVVAFDKTPWDE